MKIVEKQKSRLVINLNMSEKIEIFNKTPWFIYGFHDFILFTFRSAMEWSEDQNLALVREILITEPYRFKARTTERGKVWQQIADNPSRRSYRQVSLEEIREFLEKLEL